MKTFITSLVIATVSAEHAHSQVRKETWTPARIDSDTWGLQFELSESERETYANCLI